jgi:hypothetical protein
MSFTTAALLVSWLAIAVLALGLAGLVRQVGELRRQVALAGAGSGSPALVGLALPGSGPLARLRPRGGGVVIVVAPGCSSCHEAAGALLAAGLGPHTVAVSASTCEVGGVQGCVSDASAAVDLLAVPATPYLLAVDADGVIRGTEVPGGPQDVAAFAAHVIPLIRPAGRLDVTAEEAGT